MFYSSVCLSVEEKIIQLHIYHACVLLWQLPRWRCWANTDGFVVRNYGSNISASEVMDFVSKQVINHRYWLIKPELVGKGFYIAKRWESIWLLLNIFSNNNDVSGGTIQENKAGIVCEQYSKICIRQNIKERISYSCALWCFLQIVIRLMIYYCSRIKT